jgi:hypothetical protein
VTSAEGAAAVATLGLAAAGALGYADLPGLIYGVSPTAVVAAGAREELQRRHFRRSAGENSFYFLYQADRRL